MDLAAIPRTLLRRWLIVAIGIVLTGLGTAAVYTAVPRSYQASSQAILLLSPSASSTEHTTSPFLYLPNGLNVLARLVTASATAAGFRAGMVNDSYAAQYEADVDTQAPIVRFSVEGADPALVKATHQELLRRFAIELQRVQVDERVPPRQIAHARFVGADSDPQAIAGNRFRATAATAGIGLMLTLLAAFLAERAVRTWARRAAERLMDQGLLVAGHPAPIGSQEPDRTADGSEGTANAVATKDAGAAAKLVGQPSSDADPTGPKLFSVGSGPRG